MSHAKLHNWFNSFAKVKKMKHNWRRWMQSTLRRSEISHFIGFRSRSRGRYCALSHYINRPCHQLWGVSNRTRSFSRTCNHPRCPHIVYGHHISYLVLAPNWVSDCTTSIVCTTIPYRRQSIRLVRMESRVQGFHKLPDHLDRFGLDWNSNNYYTFIKPIIIFCILSRGRKMFLLLFKRLLRG